MWERAAVVAVGDEVLTGEVVNTNGAWLAQRLLAAGSRVVLQLVVGDRMEDIGRALATARAVSDLVVIVGGLGPTPDDLTREAVARALGRSLQANAAVAEVIRARHGRGAGHETSIRQQSQILEGAEVLPNPAGTAPGQLLRLDRGAIVLLPGPPTECRAVADALWPTLEAATGVRVLRHTLYCYDLTESEVAHYLRDILTGDHLRTGLYTRPGVVELRLETVAPADGSWPAILDETAARARAALPVPLYDARALPRQPEALVARLVERGETVALAESLTGGLLAAQLTAVPGASAVVLEANVVYTDRSKERLGISAAVLQEYGAVSAETAQLLAERARDRAGAAWGIGLTGFAGPTGGTAADPVGTYYCAVAGTDRTCVYRRRTRMGREAVREAACETARFMLAAALTGLLGD
jgi:nicotinamide-nucleotide amidase